MQLSVIIEQAHNCKFAPNSEYFLYNEDKKVYIKEASLDLKNISIIKTTHSNITDIQISPDSKLIAILVTLKALILVYSLDGEIVARIEDSQSGIVGMQWCPDSTQIIVFSEFMYKCSIYHLAQQTISYIRGPKNSSGKRCTFSNDGKFMALLQRHDCKDFVGIYYCKDWKLVNCFQIETFDASQIIWSANNSNIVVSDNILNYKLVILCPFMGVIHRYQAYDYALGIKSLRYSNSSRFIAIGSYDQKVRIINALTCKLIIELDCSKLIPNSSIKIYKQEESKKGIRQVESHNYKIPQTKNVGDKAVGIGLLDISSDDSYIACRNDGMPFTVWIWDMHSLQLDSILTLNNQIKMIKFSRNDNTLCIVLGTDRLIFWKEGEILECSFPYENRKFNVNKIVWSADDRKMLVSDKNDLVYADIVKSM